MRKFAGKMAVCAALVFCLSQAAYADEAVVSDGPVQEQLAQNAEELTQMHDGSQIPVYIAEGSTSAPEAELVAEEVLEATVEAMSTQNAPAGESGAVVSSVGPGGSTDTTSSSKGPGVANPGAKSSAGNAVSTTAKRAEVIGYAKQFLGNPYVYGGTSLTDGADCSGFTQSIFKNFGISIGRSSRDQYAKVEKISQAELKPGDLVFYASGDYINHVAIYCGNNIIIHAANESTGIATGNMNYREPYGYGRVLFD